MLDQLQTALMIDFVSIKGTINKIFQVFFSGCIWMCPVHMKIISDCVLQKATSLILTVTGLHWFLIAALSSSND